MFLLFGLRTIRKSISTGLFSCPRCMSDRNFTRQALRRFVTIFFIPLIPVKRMGEVIHCMSCQGDFTVESLDRPTVANLAEGMAAATRVAVAAMVASAQEPSPAMKDLAIETALRAGTRPYDLAHLDTDVAWVTDDVVPTYVEPFVGGLSMPVREQFLGSIAKVAVVDSPLNGRQRAMLERLSGIFGLTDTHMAGVLMKADASDNAALTPIATPPATSSSSGDFA